MEYGNYGGPNHTSGNWTYTDEKGYQYHPGVDPADKQDGFYRDHDYIYGKVELMLENGHITPEQALVEKMSADLQLVKDLATYNPFADPDCSNPLHGETYRTAAMAAFAGKMLIDMEVLIGSGVADAIIAGGNIIADLLRSGIYGLGDILGRLPSDILNRLRDLFGNAENTKSPIIIDLNNDGIMTTNLKAGVYFDHDGNGLKNGTGWIKLDDGFLVMDRNGNGIIDSGRELFGDSTLLYTGGTAADGFAALAQEDANAGGVVNHPDANWHNLKLLGDEKLLAA